MIKRKDNPSRGIYFIQFTPNITEVQLEACFDRLNKTLWYRSLGNGDLLKFEMKNNAVTPGKNQNQIKFCITKR